MNSRIHRFAGWEVRIVKNCDGDLENATRGRRRRAAFSSPRSQFFSIRTDPKPVNNLFIFIQALKRKKKKTHGKKKKKKTHASVTVTVVRDRKIQIALRTNQIVGFVTVPAWKEKKNVYFLPLTKFRTRSPEKSWSADVRSVYATPFSPV